MRFVKCEDLIKGMRLARPIYNRNGVLLYDRDTKLTKQGINSIINFKLIGIYILEPAEPLPPMTEKDKEFERFQTMSVFGIKEDMELLLLNKKTINIDRLVRLIQKNYGSASAKVMFLQNIRSEEDYVYKHTLNSAILASLIAGKMQLPVEEQLFLIKACALYDIGKILPDVDKSKCKDEYEYEVLAASKGSRFLSGSDYIDKEVKQLVVERYRLETSNKQLDDVPVAVRIMKVAQDYDNMTAMKNDGEPLSDVSAIRHLLGKPKEYDVEAVANLVASLKVLYPGVCVELTNGITGLVIKGNDKNVLRPIVLGFENNEVIDLGSKRVFENIQISDIMKTMDRRIHIDQATLDSYIKKYADVPDKNE